MTTQDSESEQLASSRPDPGRLAVFTFDSAPLFFETDMLTELGGSDETLTAYNEAWENGQDQGSVTRVLFRQRGDTAISVLHVWQKPGKVTPRHSHDSDCLYYVIAGQLRLGNRALGPGDGFFVPADHPYSVTAGDDGAELLEIRPNATSFDMQVRDQSPEKWAQFKASVRAKKPRWDADDGPPSRRALSTPRPTDPS
jgi:quercetin dioxygenase-like cupin family protein